MAETIEVSYEYTDTFGGEANYSWVQRGTVTVPANASDTAIVRKVKARLGLSGVRCRRDDIGDSIALYPADSCTVVFIG